MLMLFFVFLGLLIAGRIKEELSWSQIILCLLIAVGIALVFAAFRWHPNFYFAVLGLMDVILLLVVFKGDIQIR